MAAHPPDRSLGEAGRLRAQRSSKQLVLVSGLVVAANALVALASLEAAFVIGFYVGAPMLLLLVIGAWQRLTQGSAVDFRRAVAPRAERMAELAAGLAGGRLDRGRHQATVLGRRGGVEVEARCWIAADPLPDEDALELRLRTQRPPPWRGAYRGLRTHPPGQPVVLFGGPAPTIPDVHVYGRRKPPLTPALRERLVPLLNATERAQLEVDAEGLVLRLGASPDAFAPGRAEWLLDGLIALARALELPLSDTPALHVSVRRATAAPAAPGSTCPFCRAAVVDDPWQCQACGTTHHRACQVEHGGCTVLGCSGGADRTRSRA